MRLETIVAAQPRASRGKNEARRTRRSGLIPAVIYGAFKDPVSISLNPKDITRIIRSKTGHNSIFDVEISGIERTPVIVADEQYDPIKGNLLHIDLRRIDLTRKLRLAIPVHVSGEAKGVKQQGGVLDIVHRQLEVECLPADIPEHILVDVSDMMVGQSIRVRDVATGVKWKATDDPELMLMHVIIPKVEEVAATPEAAAGAAATAAEPEVIKKGKKEEATAAAEPAAAPAKKDKK